MGRAGILTFAVASGAALGCAAVFAMRQVDDAIDEAFGDVVAVPEGMKAAANRVAGGSLGQPPSRTHSKQSLRTGNGAS